MARARKMTGTPATGKPATGKRPIEQYDHKGQQRKNNPPVGLRGAARWLRCAGVVALFSRWYPFSHDRLVLVPSGGT